MKIEYDETEQRECGDCGHVSTVGELTPQARTPNAPAVWICRKCIATPGTDAAVYQNNVAQGWTPAARAMEGGT